MHSLWPPPDGSEPADCDEQELERRYAFPAQPDRPWVCVNFVASADGAVSVAGRSGGLSDQADRKVFLLGRDLSDVVLVGAGTVRAENYGGVKRNERHRRRRERAGLTGVPPIAVVSGSCDLRPDTRLFTETEVPPIVLTSERAPERARKELAGAGADVVVAGAETVEMPLVLTALAERGLFRVCCEGGPHLFGSLLAAHAVDELRLTIAPLLAGGLAGRIATGPELDPPADMRLDTVLRDGDTLLLRYLRRP